MSKRSILFVLVAFVFTNLNLVVVAEEILLEAEAADSIASPLEVFPDSGYDPVKNAEGKGEPSGGKYIGTTGSASGNNDLIYTEGAKYDFTVKGGTYKVVARVSNVDDDSFWMRIKTATTNTKNNSNGWVLWNGIRPQTPDWHWVAVHSSDDNKQIVHFTLSEGKHTIEWLHRENENFLDCFIITDNLELDPNTLPDAVPKPSKKEPDS